MVKLCLEILCYKKSNPFSAIAFDQGLEQNNARKKDVGEVEG